MNKSSEVWPSRQEIEELAKSGEYGVIPMWTESYSDEVTPIMALKRLQKISRHVFLLESAEDNKRWGRYTFIGYDPLLEIAVSDGSTVVTDIDGAKKYTCHPSRVIRDIMAGYKSPSIEGLPTFAGGLCGYFSYDYIKYSEPTLDIPIKDAERFDDANLMLFDKLICFDNYRQKVMFIYDAKVVRGKAEPYTGAVAVLDEMQRVVLTGEPAETGKFKLTGELTPLFTEPQYCEMVERAKAHIREGDIFQVVLSNRVEAPMKGSLLDVYRVLRTVNPSPYMFYFSGADGEIAGASPETLVKLTGGRLYTFPLAGSRKRGLTPEEDRRLEEELLADPKELAEHNMLVDLGRNDLGRICTVGSVKVEQYMQVLRYSHIMHIGSTVSGTIRPDLDAMSAIEAVLPAGTLSGAPKIRACEIIAELEDNKRGIYGGAIGYLSFTGDMDTCIGIRLAYSHDDRIYVRAGAGIVADSVPANEYRECLQKAAAVKAAIIEARAL